MPLPQFLTIPLPFNCSCPVTGWRGFPAWMISMATILLGIGAITAALIAEHIFGLAPCILCLYQRIPYVALTLLGGASLLFLDKRQSYQICMALCAVIMLVGAGIAAFHSGVEFGFWTFQRDCGAGFDLTSSVDAFLAQVQNAPAVRCDEPSWWFLGLTMASWNALFSIFAAGAYAYVARAVKA